MPNLICELEHGTPDHDNLRTPAARDLLPGELDFNPTTGAVMIADRGAKLGKESAAVVQNGRAVFRIKNPGTIILTHFSTFKKKILNLILYWKMLTYSETLH